MDQVGTGHPSFELLSAYHDAETEPTEQLTVSAHLDRCAACRKTLAGFDLLGMALQTTPAPACADLGRLLSAELDGETSPDETAVVAAHLAACGPCGAQRASWEALDLEITALPTGVPSAAADARIRGLAHRRRILPIGPVLGGGVLGRLTAATVAFALALIASLPPGGAVGRPVTTGEERPLVASVQQVLNPRTNTLYVLQSTEGVVLARNATTNAEVAHISVGGRPTALALNESANVVYVLDPSAKTYTTINGATNTVTSTASVPLTGTLTSIQVNQSTGQVVIGAASSAAPSTAPGQLAIIDPTSQQLQTRSVDVAPTEVVLDATANRMFLLGAKGLSVVDATTYATIATLPTAVAVAPSATGGADAILSIRDGRATLSFYGTSATATFDGTPVNVVGLPDGSFAILIDVAGAGRIELVDRLGGAIGSLDVVGTAKALTFDPDGKRFLGANGQVVATISGSSIALAAATTPPQRSAPPSPTPTVAPSPSPAATPAPPRSAPAGSSPSPSGGLPRTTLAAVGLTRFELDSRSLPILVAGSGARLWFVDQYRQLMTVDTRTGAVAAFAQFDPGAQITSLVANGQRVFAMDTGRSTLYVVDLSTGRFFGSAAPFARTVTSMDVAPDGRLWFGASAFSGLLVFDPLKGHFDLVPLAAGASPSAVSVDLAGRVWFIDAGNGSLGQYDPGVARFTSYALPASEAFTALRADRRGNVWLGTVGGSIYRLTGAELTRVRTAGAPIVAFASLSDGSVGVLAAGAASTLYGPVGGALSVGPGSVRSIAGDASNGIWLGDRTQPVFYIAQ